MLDNNILKKNVLLRKFVFYIYPDFLCKVSIRNSISYLINKYQKIFFKKNVLDVGCGSKPYMRFFKSLQCEYHGIDFNHYTNFLLEESSHPDFYFHNNYKKNFLLNNFKDKTYDIIVSFEVLEHHERPDIFFKECSRILKNEGILLITFPFIWNLHEEPYDYQRFTHYKIKKLCEKNNLKIIETIRRGSSLETVIQVTNLAILNINSFPLKIFLLIFTIPTQIMTYLFKSYKKNNYNCNLFLGYTILLKKIK